MGLPEPYFQDEHCTIYHGDCREILPLIEPGTIDLVLTDPPYGVGYSTGYRKNVAWSNTRLAYDLATSPLMNDTADAIVPLMNDTADAIVPLMNDTAVVYWFAAPERLDSVLPVVRRFGDVVNVLCWDKGNCTAGDLDTTYGQQWEAIIFARRSRVSLIGGRDRDVLRYSRGSTQDYLHPTQKPIPLLRYLIGRHKGGVVLDPFMGSGTTLRAAKDLGRKAIGIEIEERYCEIAAKRLSQLVLPLNVA
jgi:site-specific DNA-methyltransferase (adenine-specific)